MEGPAEVRVVPRGSKMADERGVNHESGIHAALTKPQELAGAKEPGSKSPLRLMGLSNYRQLGSTSRAFKWPYIDCPKYTYDHQPRCMKLLAHEPPSMELLARLAPSFSGAGARHAQRDLHPHRLRGDLRQQPRAYQNSLYEA